MTQIGSVYAQALYDLAKDENCSETVLQQLLCLNDSFEQESDFVRLLCAPNLSKQERCEVLDKSFRQTVHIYVLNFLKILTERGYMRSFGDCCKAYQQIYNRDNGILEVRAVTAVPLNDGQREKLTQKLTQSTGKTISLINRIDPECIGGVRLDYDGKRVDDTVAHRLDSIRAKLKNTVL